MNNEELQPATMEDINKTVDFMNDDEWDAWQKQWEDEDKKMRGIYLEHPDRKQFFEYDFVDALWRHMAEYYGRAVGDDAIEWMIYEIMDDSRIWEMVYDAAQKYADVRGWEMK